MIVSRPFARGGQSSTRKTAVATAIGTPIRRASAEVMSVPTTSGSASNVLLATSQLFPKTKSTPNFENAGAASTKRRMKKYARRARTPRERARRPHFRAWSAKAERDDRSARERPPPAVSCPASTGLRLSRPAGLAHRLSVALQPGNRLLRGPEDVRRIAGVVELLGGRLTCSERVVEQPDDVLGVGLRLTGLAEVL